MYLAFIPQAEIYGKSNDSSNSVGEGGFCQSVPLIFHFRFCLFSCCRPCSFPCADHQDDFKGSRSFTGRAAWERATSCFACRSSAACDRCPPGSHPSAVEAFCLFDSYWQLPASDKPRRIASIVQHSCGDLSFVGPRPALFNQDDLVALRTERGIHILVPGLTGWAQINGRDELPIPVKVQFDYEYLQRRSFKFDLYIICVTIIKVVRGDGIQH